MIGTLRRFAVLVILAVAAAPVRAADEAEPASLADAVRALVESDPMNADALLFRLLERNPDPLEVMPLLRDTWSPAEPGWRVRPHRYGDDHVRDFHLYVPTTYDPEEAAPLLIHMHGGVSRPALLTETEMLGYRDWWTEEAERNGMLVVFPLGEKGAEWWTETQASALEEIVKDLSRDFHLDRNRVFATGFSDGGSGSFYLSLTHPTYYAGFVPLNGHPAVASGASGRNLFPVNHGMRPLYVVNTQDDPLYPAQGILPYIRSMMEEGVAVRFTSYPGIGHTPAYRDEQDPLIGDWILDTPRDPLPDRVVWQTADLDTGRCSWVTILELGETPDAPGFRDVNVMSPPGRVLLGIRVDTEYEGEGVRVQSVTEESVAAAIGLAAGDVITRIDDAPTPGFGELRQALGAKRYGEEVHVEWTRDGEAHGAGGRFPEYTPEPTYARDRPSGRIEVTRDGNRIAVLANGVTKYALDLSPAEFDFDEEIVVTTNGKESFRGIVKPELETLLLSFAHDRDPDLLFLARLTIDLAPDEEDAKLEATAREYLASLAAEDGEQNPGRAEVDRTEHGVSVRFPRIATRVWLRPVGDDWRVEAHGADWLWPLRRKDESGREVVELTWSALTVRPLESFALPDVPGGRSLDLLFDDDVARLGIDGEGRVVQRGTVLTEDRLEAILPGRQQDILALAAASGAPSSSVLGFLRHLVYSPMDPTEPRFREVDFLTELYPRPYLARGIPATVKPAPNPKKVRLEPLPEISLVVGPAGADAGRLSAIGHLPVEGKRVRLTLDGRLRWEDALRILAEIGAGQPAEIVLDDREIGADAAPVTLDDEPLPPSDEPLEPPADVHLELYVVLP